MPYLLYYSQRTLIFLTSQSMRLPIHIPFRNYFFFFQTTKESVGKKGFRVDHKKSRKY